MGKLPQIVAFAFPALLAGACGQGEWCSPAGNRVACSGPYSGTATVVASATLGETTAVSVMGRNCLTQDGSCSDMPQVVVNAWFERVPYAADYPPFGLSIQLSPDEGPATYTITAIGTVPPLVRGGFEDVLGDGVFKPLTAASGTVVVERSDTVEFRATFDLQVATVDQLTFSLTGGAYDIGGCGLVPYPASCTPMD